MTSSEFFWIWFIWIILLYFEFIILFFVIFQFKPLMQKFKSRYVDKSVEYNIKVSTINNFFLISLFSIYDEKKCFGGIWFREFESLIPAIIRSRIYRWIDCQFEIFDLLTIMPFAKNRLRLKAIGPIFLDYRRPLPVLNLLNEEDFWLKKETGFREGWIRFLGERNIQRWAIF